MITIPTMYATMKGSTATYIRSIETPEIRDATVRLAPSGGVRKPISQVMTVNIPNRTGSTPSDETNGRKTEVNKMICASDSMNVPIKI